MKELFTQLAPFFPLLLIPGWIVALYFISKMGWSELAKQYKTKRTYESGKASVISAQLNLITYSKCLRLYFDDDGMYFRPIIFFRLFHPPLFIPWHDISAGDEQRALFNRSVVLKLGIPTVATFKISTSVFAKFETYIK